MVGRRATSFGMRAQPPPGLIVALAAIHRLRPRRVQWLQGVSLDAPARPAVPALRAITVLRTLASVVSMGAVLSFALHGARAWLFRWPIDYGEGPLLDQARRVASGENLYPPTFGQYGGLVSNYPPVYPCLLAVAGKVFGLSFPTGRAITAVTVCACAGFVGAMVRSLTGRSSPALLAIAFFVASPAVLLWSMFARVDFLALAFTLASLWVVVDRPRAPSTPYVAAVLTVGAAFTRQTHLLAGPLAVAAALSIVSARRALAFVLAVVAATLCIVVALQILTHGGFWRHVVAANIQGYRFDNVFDAGKRLLLSSAPLAMLSVWALLSIPARTADEQKRTEGAAVGVFFVGALLSSFTIGKVGSAANHLLPLVAALAILGGIGFAWTADVSAAEGENDTVRLRARAVTGVLCLQIPWMVYCGLGLAQSADDKLRRGAEFARLAAVLESEPGPVVADEAAGLVVLSGHRLIVDPFDLTQLAQAGAARQERLLSDLRAKRFGLLLVGEAPAVPDSCTHERWTPEMLDAIHNSYERHGVLAQATMYRPRR